MKTLKEFFIIIFLLTVKINCEELPISTTETLLNSTGNEDSSKAIIYFAEELILDDSAIPIEVSTTTKMDSTTIGNLESINQFDETKFTLETNTIPVNIQFGKDIEPQPITQKSAELKTETEPNTNSENYEEIINTSPSDVIEMSEIIKNVNLSGNEGVIEISSQETTDHILATSSNGESTLRNDDTSTTVTYAESSSEEPSPKFPVIGEENNKPNIPECTMAGNFSLESNCRTYYSCQGGPGEFIQQTLQCPENSAFNVRIGQCLRDISSCGEIPECSVPGIFADPKNLNYYYVCLAGRMNGFQKYHVKCDRNQLFSPILGDCFTDPNSLQPGKSNLDVYAISDLEIVKNDVKLIDDTQKLLMKSEENKIKLEKKLKKKQVKLAAKEQKRLQKLMEQNLKENPGQQNTFVCPSEGSFAMPNEKNWYYSCVLQKFIMACPLGHEFNEQSEKCLDIATQAV